MQRTRQLILAERAQRKQNIDLHQKRKKTEIMALKKVYSLSWTQDHCSDMAWIYKSFQVGNKTKYQRFLNRKLRQNGLFL